ncbi:FAD-dependent oxidoreductase [Streptomyces sp. AF1A]|uniref:FAD-dependent oxidoreductase n=1 Tax=Streptomyces sp. AF1A TaxID=3394350 RepID=UPI0039BD579D
MTKPVLTKPQSSTDEDTASVDVAVAGGGLAGLAAALTLGRARRSVLVIDAGHPRNAPAAHMHGYLTRDGENPLEMLRLGREEVRGYGGHIVQGGVASIARLDERTRSTSAAGRDCGGRRAPRCTSIHRGRRCPTTARRSPNSGASISAAPRTTPGSSPATCRSESPTGTSTCW